MPSTEPLSRCRGLATEHCVRRATAQGDTHVQGELRHEGPEGPSQMQRVEEWFRQREQHEQGRREHVACWWNCSKFRFVGAERRMEGCAKALIYSLQTQACVTVTWADGEMWTVCPLGIHRAEPSLPPSSLQSFLPNLRALLLNPASPLFPLGG